MPTKELTGLEIAHLIEQHFPGAVEEAQPEFAMIAADRLIEVMTWLRDDSEQQFKFLSSLTGVDREDWFEVVYHVESIRFNRLTAIKVRCYDRENPKVPSVVGVWQGAHLQEREAYDLFGIVFEGHPDLRRIFLWEGFAGWPLRKDYLNLPGGQMPGLEHFPGEPGVELSGRGTE
jgi:NADH-quinone oxidoreductase subunit C